MKPLWKREVALPIALTAIALTLVASLAVFEHQTGLSASIRGNPVYGSLPTHSAASMPIMRRTASTSSVKSLMPNAQKRLRMRAIQHRAASRSSISR